MNRYMHINTLLFSSHHASDPVMDDASNAAFEIDPMGNGPSPKELRINEAVRRHAAAEIW